MGITCPIHLLSPKDSPNCSKRFTRSVGSHANPSGGQPADWHALQYGPHRFDTNGSISGASRVCPSVTYRALVNRVPGRYQPGSISHPS